MRKILVLGLVLALLATGCAFAEAKPLDGGFIPVIPMGVGHQYWQAVKLGVEQAAEEYGIDFIFDGPQEETMIDKQVDILRTNITNEKLIAVCIAAIDNQSVAYDLEKVKERGIPVVGFDAGCGAAADVLCSTDNYGAGALAAENAVRLLNGEGKIAIIGHSQVTVDGKARVEGFADYIKANSNIEIVSTQYGEGDHLKSADIAKAMLIDNPDINLIYTTNEGGAVGAYNGLKEINMVGKVMLIGFDSSAALKAGVRNGDIVGAITQDPVGMGYIAVKCACMLALGEEVEGVEDEEGTIVVDTGCYWYDASNMDDPKIAPLLYD